MVQDDKDFIERSLVDSERVQVCHPRSITVKDYGQFRVFSKININMQIEDIVLCEGVQRGLETPAYCSGRYAPTVEHAMHHFHQLLHYILKE